MQIRIGMTSDQYALWALIPAAGMLLGALTSNKLRPRLGIHKTLKISPILQLCAATWLILCPMQPIWLMSGLFIMVFGNGLALPCAQTMVMNPYKSRAGVAAALSGGGQMIISSLISMGLLAIGLSEIWHLGIVIAVFALITYSNINRGFKSEVPVF